MSHSPILSFRGFSGWNCKLGLQGPFEFADPASYKIGSVCFGKRLMFLGPWPSHEAHAALMGGDGSYPSHTRATLETHGSLETCTSVAEPGFSLPGIKKNLLFGLTAAHSRCAAITIKVFLLPLTHSSSSPPVLLLLILPNLSCTSYSPCLSIVFFLLPLIHPLQTVHPYSPSWPAPPAPL